jgi:undecaprenyl-diphosphatase
MAVTKTVWGYIEGKDMRLMRRMNRWRPPRWIRLWMLIVSRLGDGLLWYVLGLMLPPDQFSFPSGHAMTSFAIAASVSHFYPDLQVCLLFSAVSVAVSRIVLGMHFLTDVVIGALIGAALGFLSVWIFTCLRFIPS